MLSRREFIKMGAALGGGMLLPMGLAERAFAFNLLGQGTPADPLALAKYVDRLPVMPVMPSWAPGQYAVGMYQFVSKVHRDMAPTTVWGYRPEGWRPGPAPENTYLGPSFVTTQGKPISVRWSNDLVDRRGRPIPHPLPVDPSLHWAAPFGDNMMDGPFPVGPDGASTLDYTLRAIPVSPHVHGGEQEPESDGGPESWFTPGWRQVGPSFRKKTLSYTNGQHPATIWYHDHALGITRLNVYMGLAGAYLITNPATEPQGLPGGAQDIPLVFQDRMFDTNGQLYFPALSDSPGVHPFWLPEFFGDTMLVNGKVWPYLEVEPRAYRFRMLNGSNARFYDICLEDAAGARGPAFHQIATDGGYLYRPVILNDPASANPTRLLMAPGERAEVVIDFSDSAGETLYLCNDAGAPFPDGDLPDEATIGRIMQFRVAASTPMVFAFPSAPLNPSLRDFPTIDAARPAKVRTLTLNEFANDNGPLEVLVNLTKWMAPVTEKPGCKTTEVWRFVNTTVDTHPIHLHLTQFQLLSRQTFDRDAYAPAFAEVNGTTPIDGMTPNDAGVLVYTPVDPAPYLTGTPQPAQPNERGWKDTIRMNPGEVTMIAVRFETNAAGVFGGKLRDMVKRFGFPFDPTARPGYVYHCHIIDHEDNEMMRPYVLRASRDEDRHDGGDRGDRDD